MRWATYLSRGQSLTVCAEHRLCARRQNTLANENAYGISEMETTHDIVNVVLLEDRRVQMWPDYPCLYDVRAA